MRIWIAGGGTTEFGVHPEATVKELVRRAFDDPLIDTGATATVPELATFGNTT